MAIRIVGNAVPIALAAAMLTGCSPSPPQPAASSPTSVDFSNRNPGTITGEPVSPDAIVSADPAATRLQDIGGYLLLYYRDHKQLPATLDDLANMPGGDSLNLTAPRSGREFGYQPTGMWSEEHPDKCIVAFDPDLRGSARWCLFMTPPTSTGGPLSVDVIAIPNSFFEKYKAAAQ